MSRGPYVSNSYTAAEHTHAPGAANTLGKYRLIAELGRGGMSEVYLACMGGPAGFNKLSVIKQIKAELAEDPDFVTMFLEEARLAARLSHPNVVQTNEVGHEGRNRYYIAMEYLEGQPYSRVLNRLGRDRGLPLGMSLRVIVDILAGLQHAHDLCDYDGTPLEVVHRDVTPHNVFVTYDGQIKVMDFGIAKAMNSSLETRTGVLKGKVGYMAPEQARGERVDRRADIFSTGVMLWEAAVGRRLWKGMNEVTVLHKLLNGTIPHPREMRPDVSERLDSICMRALAVDREMRYRSAAELQADLEELIDGPGTRTTVREIGRLVEQTFAEDRAKLRHIIDQQLTSYRSLQTGLYQQVELPVYSNPALSAELPVMRPSKDDESGPSAPTPHGSGSYSHPHGSSGSYSHPHSHSQGGHSSSGPHGGHSHPSQPSQPYLHPVSGGHPHPGQADRPPYMGTNSVPPPYAQTSPTGVTASNVTGANPIPRSNRSTILALGIATVFGGLAAAAWLGLGGAARDAETGANASEQTTDAPVATLPTAAPTPTTAAQAASSADSDLTGSAANLQSVATIIDVAQSDANVLLDGKRVKGPPFSATLEKGKDYELEVQAKGFEPEKRTLRLDDTTQLDDKKQHVVKISLPAERRVGSRYVPPPPPSDDEPDDMIAPVTAPTRELDGDNPYK